MGDIRIRAARYWSRLFSALLLMQLVALAPSAQARDRARDRGGSGVRNLCAELLTRPELAVGAEVKGAPGLRVLASELGGLEPSYEALLRADTQAFYPHELVSSARYARLISERAGESVMMVPGIENKSIPGFDGVIYDSEGKPVANYSLKTLLQAKADHTPLKRAWEGVRQAKRFSFVERWLAAFSLLTEDEAGHFRINQHIAAEQSRLLKRWLRKSMPIFGIEMGTANKRPTRVVVDIQSDVPMPDEHDTETMRKWVRESNGLIESIIFLKDGAVLEIK